jgi:hypothetical protein
LSRVCGMLLQRTPPCDRRSSCKRRASLGMPSSSSYLLASFAELRVQERTSIEGSVHSRREQDHGSLSGLSSNMNEEQAARRKTHNVAGNRIMQC